MANFHSMTIGLMRIMYVLDYNVFYVGDAVSTRWKSIRDQYSREVRKINASQSRSGARNKELYKPKWTLFKELSFLKNVIKHRR